MMMEAHAQVCNDKVNSKFEYMPCISALVKINQ